MERESSERVKASNKLISCIDVFPVDPYGCLVVDSEKQSDALVPPKPKLFVSTTLTRFSRALLAT